MIHIPLPHLQMACTESHGHSEHQREAELQSQISFGEREWTLKVFITGETMTCRLCPDINIPEKRQQDENGNIYKTVKWCVFSDYCFLKITAEKEEILQ